MGGPRRHRPSRRGAVYVLVLLLGLILTVISVSAVTVSRIRLRATSARDIARADRLARSAMERAVAIVDVDPDWRSNYMHDVEDGVVASEGGTMSLVLRDADADLDDDPEDSVRIIGIARLPGPSGTTVRARGVTLQPYGSLEFLRAAVHAEGQIDVGGTLEVSGGPVSTNGTLQLASGAVVMGDAECLAFVGSGGVTGTLTEDAPAKPLPSTDPFAYYLSIATILPFNGDMNGVVLSPNRNDYGGGLNPAGVYYINTNYNNIWLSGVRIHGTLLIDTGGWWINIDGPVHMAPYRADYPVLLARGWTKMDLDSADTPLSEAVEGVNFNPPGTAYEGVSDNDQADQYPNVIRGLVHGYQRIKLAGTTRIEGMVIGEDRIEVGALDHPVVVGDPNLRSNPPVGYAVPRLYGWDREKAT